MSVLHQKWACTALHHCIILIPIYKPRKHSLMISRILKTAVEEKKYLSSSRNKTKKEIKLVKKLPR